MVPEMCFASNGKRQETDYCTFVPSWFHCVRMSAWFSMAFYTTSILYGFDVRQPGCVQAIRPLRYLFFKLYHPEFCQWGLDRCLSLVLGNKYHLPLATQPQNKDAGLSKNGIGC